MNISEILDAVEDGIKFAEKLTPFAAILGVGPILGTVTGIAGSVTKVLQNVNTRISEGKLVASSDDEIRIRELTQRLADQNDALNAAIRAS